MIREGMIIHAEPQENHLEHLLVHNQLLNSPDILLWPKELIEFLRAHIAEHEQMMQLILQFQGAQQKGGDLGQQGDQAGGGQAAPGGAASPTSGKSGIQSSANPADSAARNQTQGTTLGTPKVR